MTIIIESTKGRYVYRNHDLYEAVAQGEQWICEVRDSNACAILTITVHQDDENCDHEHPEET